jgi:hypothetical protein
MKSKSLLFSGLFLASIAFAQNDWLEFPGNKKDSVITANKTLDFTKKNGSVTVKQDPRLDQLGKFVRTGEDSHMGVKMDGYRIMIFFDQSKDAAEQQKAIFLSRYAPIKAYVDYTAPNYRVRVGNYRTRLEAEALKAEILATFPTAIVVEDKIQLPALPAE